MMDGCFYGIEGSALSDLDNSKSTSAAALAELLPCVESWEASGIWFLCSIVCNCGSFCVFKTVVCCCGQMPVRGSNPCCCCCCWAWFWHKLATEVGEGGPLWQWTINGIGPPLQVVVVDKLVFIPPSTSSPGRCWSAKLLICSSWRVRVLIPMSSTVFAASSFRTLLPSAVFADSLGSTLLSIRTLDMCSLPRLARSWLTQSAVVVEPVAENDRTCTKP